MNDTSHSSGSHPAPTDTNDTNTYGTQFHLGASVLHKLEDLDRKSALSRGQVSTRSFVTADGQPTVDAHEDFHDLINAVCTAVLSPEAASTVYEISDAPSVRETKVQAMVTDLWTSYVFGKDSIFGATPSQDLGTSIHPPPTQEELTNTVRSFFERLNECTEAQKPALRNDQYFLLNPAAASSARAIYDSLYKLRDSLSGFSADEIALAAIRAGQQSQSKTSVKVQDSQQSDSFSF